MDIYTAAQYMKLGYRITRKIWLDAYIGPDNNNCDDNIYYELEVDDLVATDWEIITEDIVTDFPITYKD